jgi:hypothetical protein
MKDKPKSNETTPETEENFSRAFEKIAQRLQTLANDGSSYAENALQIAQLNRRFERIKIIARVGYLVMIFGAILPTALTMWITAHLYGSVVVSLISALVSIFVFNILFGLYGSRFPRSRYQIARESSLPDDDDDDDVGYDRLHDLERFVPFDLGLIITDFVLDLHVKVWLQIQQLLSDINSSGWKKVLRAGMKNPDALEYVVSPSSTPGSEHYTTVCIRSRSNPEEIHCELDPSRIAQELGSQTSISDPDRFREFIANLKEQIHQVYQILDDECEW